jgi:hypothetical protein
LRQKSANDGLLLFIANAREEFRAQMAYRFGIVEGKLRIHLPAFEMARLAL